MRCSRAKKSLSPYLDGELKGAQKTLYEEHVGQCPKCSLLLEQTRSLSDLFQKSGRFQTPAGFSAQVMDKIARQPPRLFSLWPFWVRFTETCAITVAITLGAMSGGILVHTMAPHTKESAVVAGLSLEVFDALPSNSLAKTYLAMTEERP